MIYEKYETEWLDTLPENVVLYSEMAEAERRFVNGLIRYHRPKRLLELGVAAGAGTCVLLNAIKDDAQATLTSIDCDEQYYRNTAEKTGYLAENFSQQWSMIRGKDFSEVYEDFHEKFDFCIIDTAHIHPIESLNFLCVLPFLTEDAIVVLHDTSAYTKWSLRDFPRNVLIANAYCYNSIVGIKMKPVDEDYLFHCGGMPNIGAVILNADSRRYIGNLLENLNLPWGMFPKQYLEAIFALVQKKYDDEIEKQFIAAVETNMRLVIHDYDSQAPICYDEVLEVINRINAAEKLIFYGFGNNTKGLIAQFQDSCIKLPSEIWDRTADAGLVYQGIELKKPLFETLSEADNQSVLVVNTLSDYWLKTDVEYFFRERRFLNIIKYEDIQKALLIKWFLKVFKNGGKV